MLRPPLHQWLPHWLRLAGYDVPAGDAGKLKNCLRHLGMSSRTFKLYAEYGDALIRALGSRWLSPDQPEESLANAIAYLRLLNGCELDIAPPRELVAAMQNCIPSGEPISAIPVAVFRGAWRALAQAEYRGVSASAFIEDEFIPVISWWFTKRASVELDHLQAKSGWPWLRGRWTEARKRRSLPPKGTEWSAPLRSAEVGHLRFLPLRSLSALRDEGEVMRHCVADLADCCRKGCIHVFSVRDARTLERVATLALQGRGSTWTVVDLKGEENATPDESVVRAVLSFVRCVEESVDALEHRVEACEECVY